MLGISVCTLLQVSSLTQQPVNIDNKMVISYFILQDSLPSHTFTVVSYPTISHLSYFEEISNLREGKETTLIHLY